MNIDFNVLITGMYIVSAVFFTLGLKGLGHPKSAVAGNLMSAFGMFVAIVATLLNQEILSFQWIIIGIAAGSIVGAIIAFTIQMTAMPQMVGLFNGFGGAASVLVATAALFEAVAEYQTGSLSTLSLQFTISSVLSALIGAVTFWGSLIAFGKLSGLVSEKSVRFPGDQLLKIVVGIAIIVVAVLLIFDPENLLYLWILIGLASLLGLQLTVPIGGADMPIVIALLNSYSGIAAAATGFVINNPILIIAGSLVGASGIILTQIMCKAMNRSLLNVLFGGLGGSSSQGIAADDVYAGKVKSTSADEVAMILKMAQRVVFVPGYGMAVARAQTAVRQLTEAMETEGIQVQFGIHPVAGRMPGHMNVLLAEENISYDKLREMDQINAEFSATDVAIVLGANDVVNPLAREASGSPIAGMPILNVDYARTVVVIKRSLSPGFAGIPNPLFAAENTLMLFGDGKKVMEELVTAFKEA